MPFPPLPPSHHRTSACVHIIGVGSCTLASILISSTTVTVTVRRGGAIEAGPWYCRRSSKYAPSKLHGHPALHAQGVLVRPAPLHCVRTNFFHYAPPDLTSSPWGCLFVGRSSTICCRKMGPHTRHMNPPSTRCSSTGTLEAGTTFGWRLRYKWDWPTSTVGSLCFPSNGGSTL
jgi:hypothetical protein